MSDQEDIVHHRRVHTNGIWIRFAEKGKGKGKGKEGQALVLLIHGFPQLSSAWTFHMERLAESGYRVVAPDMRGYGDSDCPPDPASYTVFHLVGDLIGLLDNLGEKQAFVVGHDWGAQVAWYLCLFRPDRVKALVNMGIIYRPPSPVKPLEFMTQNYGEGFYISQFQEPGRAERSFSRYDCLTILKKFLLVDAPDLLAGPPGTEIIDFLNMPASLPAWITEEELQKCASKFEKTGFTGALNYYRAMDLNWELLGPWREAKINVPTKFIVGNKDVGFESFGTKDHIEGEGYKSHVPNMEVVVIDGHHFIHQERAELVSTEILSFFKNHSML